MRRNSSNVSRSVAARGVVERGRLVDGVERGVAVDEPEVGADGSSSSGSAKPRARVRSSAFATSRRSCHVWTSALPDAGYTGTSTPVSAPGSPGSAITSTTGFVIWRRPR